MKLSEIVTQLQLILPKYTAYFSESISVSSIVSAAGVATINAPDHGLVDGVAVTISNVAQETPIDSVSKDGNIVSFGNPVWHDLTLGYPGYENVTLGGFTDSAWNGSFKLMDVDTRKSFKVQSTNSLPTLNGNEYILEVRVDGVNGRHDITVIDDDNISVAGDFADGTYLDGTSRTGVRVAGSINIERTLDEYTKQVTGDMWAFISMNDAIASKDRNAGSDATASFANGEEPRLRLLDGFAVFLIGNTTKEIAAVDLLDIFRHDMLSPLLKSLSGVRFSTGLSGSADFKTILTGHNFVAYNKAYLVYQYNFQFISDISTGDQAEDEDTRAFSKVDYTQSIGGDDTTDMTFDPELPD